MTARPEAILERQVLFALEREYGADLAIFKNEVGEGYYANVGPQIIRALHPFGPEAQRAAQAVLNRGRVHYGLRVGSADLIGFAKGGRGVSIELKSERGQLRADQEVWLRNMQAIGVAAGVCRTPGDAVLLVRDAIKGSNR